jgi:ubiquinone/menaquinone biosynthesis C-methylase UbiE
MPQKDLFSGHASIYAAFRPTYPQALYDHVLKYVKGRDTAWDCATGNGQVASVLSQYFTMVEATDISQAQLEKAQQKNNIHYTIGLAEESHFADRHFDLITVAQAFHWFDQPKFFQEAKRVLKSTGVLAIWGYGLLSIDRQRDAEILHLYKNVVGPYWDSARRLVDEGYQKSSFPLTEIPSPPFFIRVSWTLNHLAGYLESWSATQQYIQANGTNPVTPLINKFKSDWHGDEEKLISFPIFLRMGRFEPST